MAQATLRSKTPLSLDQIRSIAPSVFAEHAREDRSDRYAFIPTSNVLAGLQRAGFQVFEAGQTITRNPDNKSFTKHLLRLRRDDGKTLRKVGDEFPEVVLLNSHDGTTAYQLIGGIFRLVCLNGMVVGKSQQDVAVRHSGNVVDNVIEGSFRVVEELEKVAERVEEYSSIQLKEPEQLLLARAAITARWGDATPVTPQQINQAQRYDDNKPDLWTTFNRIQENVTKGNQPGRGATGRRLKTRPVGSIGENTNLNRALWTLADEFAKLKQA